MSIELKVPHIHRDHPGFVAIPEFLNTTDGGDELVSYYVPNFKSWYIVKTSKFISMFRPL